MKQSKKRVIFLEALGVLFFILFMLPLLLVLINSAKDAFDVTQYPLRLPEDWGQLGRNVANIWANPNVQYSRSFFSSVLITVLSLLFIMFLSSQAAWVLVRTKSRLSIFIFTLFVATMVIPFQIVMFPLLSWFRTVTDFTGIRLLRTYGGMILAYLGFGSSLSIFMYHGFIKSIPYELEEAASIDGCGRIRTFYTIIHPILKPIHATVLVLNSIWIWNDYLLPLLILGKSGRVMTIPLAVSNFAGAYVKQWDLILTAILMSMVPVIIFFLLAQRSIIKGMVQGSIK
ncbi:hypothetical protein S1OALGB6SA_1481 [Olavius algarvensis spirochete endosymbiont]|uniref:carbohydrate ABC transporter permease n=1 Tax=Olavius algarvensis spirochete endosymbiont TaxID=260710 RepID=UPI00052E0748|nr:carbohydrate ABC transporter permease [Olavius algarvensis spirochete endosymbiont]KGM43526.1 sugar ABC transporter permease [Alkalispirochaeta odontotermitis]CAD7842530.1 MAG: ABC transporter, permease protein 2 (cluster 1, maltose/g3p/polyamine/iron) [Olavius algarvensis spirochete endosymbiont]VDB00403.1 hypothetical protein S1OALGB6SA_1481 [Olavius algarvensis spirochete endosymbiont]